MNIRVMSFCEMFDTPVDDWLAEPEPQAEDAWSLPGYDYLGTRCIISGGEVLEIGATTKEDSDTNIPF